MTPADEDYLRQAPVADLMRDLADLRECNSDDVEWMSALAHAILQRQKEGAAGVERTG